MPYKFQLTDEAFRPIAGVVTYNDLNGVVVATEEIPLGGVFTLNPVHVANAFDVTFKSKGYYDFTVPFHVLDEEDLNDITLQAKPSHTTEIIAGLSIVGIIYLFFKKAV